jgi:hypothetical protein
MIETMLPGTHCVPDHTCAHRHARITLLFNITLYTPFPFCGYLSARTDVRTCPLIDSGTCNLTLSALAIRCKSVMTGHQWQEYPILKDRHPQILQNSSFSTLKSRTQKPCTSPLSIKPPEKNDNTLQLQQFATDNLITTDDHR